MGRQRSLAREQVRSTLPDRGKGWKWSPTRRENGIGWSTDRPSQLHFPHSWRLVRLHPVLSDKLLAYTPLVVETAGGVHLRPRWSAAGRMFGRCDMKHWHHVQRIIKSIHVEMP